jgi:hypothetical protein
MCFAYHDGVFHAAGTLNTVVPALPLLKATAAAGRPAAIAITSSVSLLPKDAVQFSGEPFPVSMRPETAGTACLRTMMPVAQLFSSAAI